ncbi:MAG TPA: hypothetical protein DCS69_13810, partial [Marinobacter adhaerens]|nr:hypothetical protein [Marinobacter adhaerens]
SEQSRKPVRQLGISVEIEHEFLPPGSTRQIAPGRFQAPPVRPGVIAQGRPFIAGIKPGGQAPPRGQAALRGGQDQVLAKLRKHATAGPNLCAACQWKRQ